jgi:hypothetical protein
MEGIGLGIIIGIGLASLTRITRPAVKEALKVGLITLERVKSALGEGRERLADLVAEAREEISREPRAAERNGSDGVLNQQPDPPAAN